MRSSKKQRKFIESEFVDLDSSQPPLFDEANVSKDKKKLRFNDKIEMLLFERQIPSTPKWYTESKARAIKIKLET